MKNKLLKRIFSSVLLMLMVASSFDVSVLATEEGVDTDLYTIEEEYYEEPIENVVGEEILEENTEHLGTEIIENTDDTLDLTDDATEGLLEEAEIFDVPDETETSIDEEEIEVIQSDIVPIICEEVSPEEIVDLDASEISLEDYIDYKIDNDLYPRFYASSYSGDNLTGLNKKMYENVKKTATLIASGAENSTVVSLSTEEVGIDPERYYSASELGVDEIVKDGSISKVAQEAILAKHGLDVYSIKDVLGAVRRDCPFEAYWMGLNYAGDGYQYTCIYSEGEYKLALALENSRLSIYITPSGDYQGATDYTVDSTKINAVNSAIANIETVVSNASGKDDLGKLQYYSDQICNYTDYNLDVYNNGYTYSYGDPWQLIYVFDGDSSTKVVCEGYSKAFAYLCEKSTFTTSSIKCYTADGNGGRVGNLGGHMWNIVHWKDGVNYLVDVTFTDTDNKSFFMILPESGNVNSGYNFKVGSQSYSYVYSDETKSQFQTDQITLGDSNQSEEIIYPDGLNKLDDGKWYYFVNNVIQTSYTGLVDKDGVSYYVQKGTLIRGVNGLTNIGNKYYYLSDSEVDKSYTGLTQYGNNLYYVTNGILAWGVNTLTQYGGTWYYVNNSTLDWNYTGIFNYGGTDYYIQEGVLKWGVNGLTNVNGIWYYLSNSTVEKDYTGLVQYGNSWYYVQKGVLVWGVNTLVNYNGTWYYVKNSTVDFSYTGIFNYGGTDYYIQKGVIEWGVNGLTNVGGTWYYLNNSAVNKGYTGLVQLGSSWYYVQSGVLKWGVNTLVQYNGTWYYVKNSTVDFGYTGIFNYGGTDYYIQKGAIKWGVNGLTNVGGTWYYLSNSAVDKKYTSLINYGGTWYYVNSGKLDWNYTGLTNYGGTWYYVQKGVLKWGANTLVCHNGTWYYVNNSAVDWKYTGLFNYGGTWYYIQKGVLKWGVNTLVLHNGTWYYINNSSINWNYTGLVNYNGTWYYVQKGVLKWGVNTLVLYNGTWYYVNNSAINWNYTGLVLYNGTWYYIQKGVLRWGVNTLVLHNGTWYYINNSSINWNYTGLVPYNGTLYYVQKGVLKWGYSGKVKYNGKTYTVSNSMAKK